MPREILTSVGMEPNFGRPETAAGETGSDIQPRGRSSAVNNFDLIRLFAATEVALKHALVHMGYELPWLDSVSIFPGVPIFFFISGYLIYQSWFNSRSAAQFAANRLVRIYPALFACFIVAILIAGALGGLTIAEIRPGDFLIWTAAQLSIAQFYNPDFLRDFGVGVLNGSLWTITVELQFYIATPILAFFVARWRWGWGVGIISSIAANLALYTMAPDSTPAKLLMVTLLPWFYMFMVGAWLARRRDWIDRILALPWRWCLALFVGMIAISLALGMPYSGNSIGPLAFAGLVPIILKAAYSKPWLADRILRRNDISYGVYIYHMPLVNGLIALGFTGTPWAVIVVLALTYLCAWLSWKLVERPALSLKSRTLRRVA